MQIIITTMALSLMTHTYGSPSDFHDISCHHTCENGSFIVGKTVAIDEDYPMRYLYDPSTGQRSHSFYNHMLQIIHNYSHNSNISNNPTVAYNDFALCLDMNREQLKVKDLKDLYRLRGIPTHCCASLAAAVIPIELMDIFHDKDKGENCRINSFFVPNGAFDPHTHPLFFTSVIVNGAYTHSYLEKETSETSAGVCVKCEPMFDEVCTEQNRIYRKSADLPLEYHGTVKLYKTSQESFVRGDIIVYGNNEEIHTIYEYFPDTVTVNWVSTIGDDEIDVFTDHQTPERTVLTKPDTRYGLKGPLASAIIDKSIGFFI